MTDSKWIWGRLLKLCMGVWVYVGVHTHVRIILKKVLPKSLPLLPLFLRHICPTPDELCHRCLWLARSSSHRLSGIKTFPVFPVLFLKQIWSRILPVDWQIPGLLAPFASYSILLITATPGSLRVRLLDKFTLRPSCHLSLTTLTQVLSLPIGWRFFCCIQTEIKNDRFLVQQLQA